MLQIHIRGVPISGIPRQSVGADGAQECWYAYDPDRAELGILQDAISLIRDRVIGNDDIRARCNERFQAIAHIDFDTIVNGAAPIYTISRSPSRAYAGITFGRHVSLGWVCFNQTSREECVNLSAATLIHELAHAAAWTGGAALGFIAESAVRACGFEDQFAPGPIGRNFTVPAIQRALRALA